MAQLLDRLGIAREAVRPWSQEAAPQSPRPAELRASFANLALRPAGGTARWHEAKDQDFDAALEGVQRVDCTDPDEEALVVALLLRRQEIGRASCRERVCQYV